LEPWRYNVSRALSCAYGWLPLAHGRQLPCGYYISLRHSMVRSSRQSYLLLLVVEEEIVGRSLPEMLLLAMGAESQVVLRLTVLKQLL